MQFGSFDFQEIWVEKKLFLFWDFHLKKYYLGKEAIVYDFIISLMRIITFG